MNELMLLALKQTLINQQLILKLMVRTKPGGGDLSQALEHSNDICEYIDANINNTLDPHQKEELERLYKEHDEHKGEEWPEYTGDGT